MTDIINNANPPSTPTWVPGLDILAGEDVDDRIIRFLNVLNGVSLHNKPDVLKALIGRGVDPPGLNAYLWQTNCATSALGVLAAACGTVDNARAFHALLGTVSKIGTSISWVYQIARDLGVAFKPGALAALPPVCLLGYANGGHVEWKLGPVDPATGLADHGGGGRSLNEITVGHGVIAHSAVGPLTDVFDFCQVLRVLAPSPDIANDNVTDNNSPETAVA